MASDDMGAGYLEWGLGMIARLLRGITVRRLRDLTTAGALPWNASFWPETAAPEAVRS